MKTKLLTTAALGIALVFLATRVIQIPVPFGYLNLGNAFILVFCTLLPVRFGVAVGSIGSALADLTSFPIYTLPTMVIKAVMPLFFYIFEAAGRKSGRMILYHIGAWISMMIPLVGYFFAAILLYGTTEAGVLQIPGLLVEYAANAVVFSLVIQPVKKIEGQLRVQ